ncbi:hypothetical protein DFQ27_003017 [Actinomortierella ambigua]|uniref:Uncharacterized protein n=1 Tax=Actinomortierella ambigua TaxID=1343610 RepID=A0A9P6UCT3_9FUNG|nr:hypothetical protein DFQ27_003017 [Actinomortierella ambigua]
MGRAKPSMPNLQKLIALFQQVECVRLCRHTDSITARLKIVPGPSPGVLSSEDACIQTTPAPAQPLKEGGRFMTHLHIDGMHLMKSDPEFMLSFSAFLCSDAAMHLEELVAPKVEYTTTTFIEVDHIEQHMWTCRNLKVLALSFGTETQADRNDWYPARTMLAFIVVNCPRLRYLEISRHVFNMSVRCGVCFLSRLEHLEQLVITTSQFTSWGGHQGSVKLARWMRVKPTLVDMVLGQSSLVLCRRIAKLDDEMGYFGLPEGRRMLWPPKTYRSAARRKDPIATASASEGACWRRLRSIRIQITGVVKDDMKVKAEQEVALMRKAFPGIEYSLCYGENI